MMMFAAQFQKHLEDTCQEVLDDEHPVPVETVGGQEPLVFEGSSQPGDEGLLLGTPRRQGSDPHGHTRFAAVLAGKKPLPAAGTIVVRAADASAMAGEGVGHA
jgi:hypothetical protein